MRLIDADELLGKMDERYKAKEPIVSNTLAEGFVQMEKLIKEQPTAYDIDKVVEELKNQMPFCPTNSFTEGAESALLDAIEIVKQGLKEQNMK